MIVARLAERALGFASIACLARLLTPADFGLVAMAGSVAAFIEVFSAFGFDWALVRHPAPTRAHYDSVWSLRILLGALTAAALLAAGPLTAAFYRQPATASLLNILALCALVGSLENIGVVDFRRNFEFSREFWLRTSSRIVGFVLSVTIAYLFHSYWALVLGTLGSRVAGTSMSYALHPYRPRWSLAATKELLGFSVWLLATNLVEFMRVRFADFFVGRVFGPRTTGIYSVASEIAHLSTTELAAPINRAVFSMYSKNSHDIGAMRSAFLQVASVIWMAALPMAAGIVATSNEIVAMLLGPAWADAGLLVRILAIGGGLSVMTANVHYVYVALGYTRLSTIVSAAGLVVMVVLAPIGASVIGLPGVGCAYVAATAVGIPLNYYLLRRLVGIRFLDLWPRVWRCMAAALGMLAVILAVFSAGQPASLGSAIETFASKVVLGAASYSAILYVTWRLAGRPDGPESTALAVARDRLKVLRARS
jgi:lipopolysaccharide exporter